MPPWESCISKLLEVLHTHQTSSPKSISRPKLLYADEQYGEGVLPINEDKPQQTVALSVLALCHAPPFLQASKCPKQHLPSCISVIICTSLWLPLTQMMCATWQLMLRLLTAKRQAALRHRQEALRASYQLVNTVVTVTLMSRRGCVLPHHSQSKQSAPTSSPLDITLSLSSLSLLRRPLLW